MAEVAAATTILEDKDVDPLEVDAVLMEADRVPLRKTPDNVGIVDIVIISLKSAGKNLVDLSGHSYPSLILLPRAVLLRSPRLLIRALSQLYCRRSIIDSDS